MRFLALLTALLGALALAGSAAGTHQLVDAEASGCSPMTQNALVGAYACWDVMVEDGIVTQCDVSPYVYVRDPVEFVDSVLNGPSSEVSERRSVLP